MTDESEKPETLAEQMEELRRRISVVYEQIFWMIIPHIQRMYTGMVRIAPVSENGMVGVLVGILVVYLSVPLLFSSGTANAIGHHLAIVLYAWVIAGYLVAPADEEEWI